MSRIILIISSLLLSYSVCAQNGDIGSAPAVAIAQATVESFPLEVEALGNARANESVEIRPLINATLTKIRFEEGMTVQAGDVLVELENVEQLSALAAAKANLAESEAQFQRLSTLYKTNVVAQSQLQEITARREADIAAVAAAEARLAHTVITSPFDGRLGLRRVSAGSLVGPDTVITTLDDTASIKLDFSVPEVFLAQLEPGLEVTAHSVAYPDTTFSGLVSSVDTRVDPVSRTITVRSIIENTENLLRAGMFLNVNLLRQDIETLMIPEEAIVPERSQQFVWVIGAQNIAQLREVKTGRRRPGQVEVLEGLSAGEQVVIEGTQKARSGQAVRLVEPSA